MFTNPPPRSVESTASDSLLDVFVGSVATIVVLLAVLAGISFVVAIVDGPPPFVFSVALAAAFVVLVGFPLAGRLFVRTFVARLDDWRTEPRAEHVRRRRRNGKQISHRQDDSDAEPVSPGTRPPKR